MFNNSSHNALRGRITRLFSICCESSFSSFYIDVLVYVATTKPGLKPRTCRKGAEEGLDINNFLCPLNCSQWPVMKSTPNFCSSFKVSRLLWCEHASYLMNNACKTLRGNQPHMGQQGGGKEENSVPKLGWYSSMVVCWCLMYLQTIRFLVARKQSDRHRAIQFFLIRTWDLCYIQCYHSLAVLQWAVGARGNQVPLIYIHCVSLHVVVEGFTGKGMWNTDEGGKKYGTERGSTWGGGKLGLLTAPMCEIKEIQMVALLNSGICGSSKASGEVVTTESGCFDDW